MLALVGQYIWQRKKKELGILINNKHEIWQYISIDESGYFTGYINTTIEITEEQKHMFIEIDENTPTIESGWRYINGEWIEPIPLSKEEKELQELQIELHMIENELRGIFDNDRFEEFLNSHTTTITHAFSTHNQRKEELLSRRNEILEKIDDLTR